MPRSWKDSCHTLSFLFIAWHMLFLDAGEENLLMDEDRHYPSESILVHEFAHTVMAVGMNEDQRQAVISAYFNARSSQLYKPGVYMMANADEYWAEGAQAWFEATVRIGESSVKTHFLGHHRASLCLSIG